MIVLAVDSSSNSATVALVRDDKLIGEISLNDKKQHSILLMPMIDNLLKYNDLTIDNIDGFVVSKGPGSFTGLRIGMATIKGLSMGSGKPAISVSNLDGLANNVKYFDGIICPIMDALRGNVYSSLYKSTDDKLQNLTDYMVISIEELIEKLLAMDDKVIFIGDGTEKYADVLKAKLPRCVIAPNHLNFARASSLGEIGIELLKNGVQDDLNTSSPFYLRKPQAERELEEKMNRLKGVELNGK